jgi:hypothetical protein
MGAKENTIILKASRSKMSALPSAHGRESNSEINNEWLKYVARDSFLFKDINHSLT